jgi:hypothetical protein
MTPYSAEWLKSDATPKRGPLNSTVVRITLESERFVRSSGHIGWRIFRHDILGYLPRERVSPVSIARRSADWMMAVSEPPS